MKKDDSLKNRVREWSTRTPPPEIVPLLEGVQRRHNGIAAVLFYGSCLRTLRADEGIADLYLLVDDYGKALRSPLQALLNRLLPPNVFYFQVPWDGKTLRAKYAVLTLRDFAKGAGRWFHSYIWGRFAQPSGLIYVRSARDALQVQEALARAVCTFIEKVLPQAPETFTVRDLWTTGLSLTYRCELRSEKPAAVARLFDAAPEYYEAVTREALKALGLPVEILPGEGPVRFRSGISPREKRRNGLAWRLRMAQGKGLSVLRLLKGSLTFENGLDYILWKIERHSGERIAVGPTLRRFPRLAACVTLWRLFRRGAFR